MVKLLMMKMAVRLVGKESEHKGVVVVVAVAVVDVDALVTAAAAVLFQLTLLCCKFQAWQ